MSERRECEEIVSRRISLSFMGVILASRITSHLRIANRVV